MKFWYRKKQPVRDIAPDEIFLDAHNLPRFNRDQFEGKIEMPISRRALFFFTLFLGVLGIVAIGRVFFLQIVEGTSYAQYANNNRLDEDILFPQRGAILDRTGIELAWNESRSGITTSLEDTFPFRRYNPHPAFSHILGYVRYPQKDRNGYYFQTTVEGVDGLELQYNALLSGETGHMITERNAIGEIISQSTVRTPVDGEALVLTIDSRLQKVLYDFSEELSKDVGFLGATGVVMDVTNGEIIVLMSMPGYNPNDLLGGTNPEKTKEYFSDKKLPFLNRAVGGLYTPGSVIKPFLAFAALAEHIVTPEKEFYSDGALRVPNPYNPDKPTVFRDWKAHGWVDMRRALAVSSNVYFMTIGGGFGDQKGLGIHNIDKYVHMFGIGESTGVDIPGEVEGVVPSIEWKKEMFPNDPWRLGDTYNSSIGQYGFQVTPIQMVRAVALLANGGLQVVPHIRADESAVPVGTLLLSEKFLGVVREGMREAVLDGTARALNVPYVSIAGKTGTAELGVSKEKVNSWVMGFWPYENPRYAFVMVMEKGPVTNLIGSASVMRRFFDWIHIYAPEYFSNTASN